MINSCINDLVALRAKFKGILESHSIEQLNLVPEHCSNNIIWNVAHSVVTHQLLCYDLADLPMNVPQSMVDAYRKGTRPEKDVNEDFVKEVLHYSDLTIAKIREDLKSNRFSTYKGYPTSFGITLSTEGDAIRYNNVHEALHLGTILALKKWV